MDNKANIKNANYLELLKIPSFLIFLIGRFVSSFGDVLFTLATTWYVLTTTNSAIATALVPIMPIIIRLTLSLPLGTIVDRYPKKIILIYSDVLRGIIILSFFFVMLFSEVTPVYIYIVNIILTIGRIMFTSAEQAALPNILPNKDRELMPANALLAATDQSINLFGYGVGGIIIAFLGTELIILIDGFTFFFSAISFLFIRINVDKTHNVNHKHQTFFKDSLEGIKFILKNDLLRSLVFFAFFVNLFGAPLDIFSAIFSEEVLGAGIIGYGYLEAGAATGALLGALLSGKLSSRLTLKSQMFISLSICGITLILIALNSSLWLSVVLFALCMGSLALLNVPLISSFQLLAPDHIRGRVMSALGMFFNASVPLGLIIGGWIINILGSQVLFGVVGCLILLMGFTSLTIKAFNSTDESEEFSVEITEVSTSIKDVN